MASTLAAHSAPSLLVLADDFTGAAEIAAIGVEHGLKTELATTVPEQCDAALLVIDTDSRPMSDQEAERRVKGILGGLGQVTTLFKKTDSVLRGQIRSELRAVQEMLRIPAALLVPQNPSKGRTIIGGRYLIDGVPLHQTSFQSDPEYPRTSADVRTLLGGPSDAPDLHIGDHASGIRAQGITVGNAASEHDVRQWAMIGNREDCLCAGGADFFRAFLAVRGHARTRSPINPMPAGKMLVACGSAVASSRELVERWHHRGVPVSPMPEGGPELDCAASWAQQAAAQLHEPGGGTILCIRHAISPDRAVAYRCCMAETVRRLLDSTSEDLTLVIEGGATAAAIRESLACTEFEVLGNLAPGVVAMQSQRNGRRLRIVLKPGSYPWPGDFLHSPLSARV
ncbi:MAG: four-carbon acid sugar kinase family protein [Phycisphaerae bacterium]